MQAMRFLSRVVCGQRPSWAEAFCKMGWFAKERGLGLISTPIHFAHPKVKDNLTLSSPDAATVSLDRMAGCIRHLQYLQKRRCSLCYEYLDPDGYKDIRQTLGPRARFKDSWTDLSIPYARVRFMYVWSTVCSVSVLSPTP